MNVGQLIELLQRFPEDETIYVRDLANGDVFHVLNVAPYDEDEEWGTNWALTVEYDSEG